MPHLDAMMLHSDPKEIPPFLMAVPRPGKAPRTAMCLQSISIQRSFRMSRHVKWIDFREMLLSFLLEVKTGVWSWICSGGRRAGAMTGRDSEWLIYGLTGPCSSHHCGTPMLPAVELFPNLLTKQSTHCHRAGGVKYVSSKRVIHAGSFFKLMS